MDIRLTTNNSKQNEHVKENYDNHHQQQQQTDASSMMAPTHHPSLPFPKEHEPWRGSSSSSGFGLANILNRTVNNSNNGPNPSLPKFSLPSLHSFGKPLITKPELPMNTSNKPPSHLMLHNPHPHHEADLHMHDTRTKPSTSSARPFQHHNQDGTTSPVERKLRETPRKGGSSSSSRRIAPAPADDEDGDGDDDLGSSIRGGRWTGDEHERFLEGFRIHGHKWKRVQQVVRTRSVTQVRTHAQKYLLKVAKLKAEKKAKRATAMNEGRYQNQNGQSMSDYSSDVEVTMGTVPSTPDRSRDGADERTAPTHAMDDVDVHRSPLPPRKKFRSGPSPSYHPQPYGGMMDTIDQEYIAAAATTLCFLMTQKIDSLFDSRHDMDNKDLEPYDCYSSDRSPRHVSAANGEDDRQDSRKRTYMHFLTDSPMNTLLQVQYQSEKAPYASYEDTQQRNDVASAYTIEGKRLCS